MRLRYSRSIIIHVDTDYLPLVANQAGCHVTHLAATGTQIQHHIALLDIARRVTTAIVFLDDLIRQDGQQTRVIGHRATQ